MNSKSKYEASFGGLMVYAVTCGLCAALFLSKFLVPGMSSKETIDRWLSLALFLSFALQFIMTLRQAGRAYQKKHGRPVKEVGTADRVLSAVVDLIFLAAGCALILCADWRGETPYLDAAAGIFCVTVAGLSLCRGIRERRSAA